MKKIVAIMIMLLMLLSAFTACSGKFVLDDNYIESNANDSTHIVKGTEIIAGDYIIVGQPDKKEDSVRDDWNLRIYEDKEIDYWYLNIYDNKTNTGIYGPIDEIDKSSITVWYGPDYYTEMPSPSWKVDGDKFILEYTITDNGIELSNGGKKLEFKRIKQ